LAAKSSDEYAIALASAAAARAAIRLAGSEPTLDRALKRAAEALCRRFSADHVSFFVHRSPNGPHVASFGTMPITDEWLRARISHPDPLFRSTLADESAPLAVDLASVERSPVLEEAFAFGVRAGMRLALRDERGQLLGIVIAASRQPGAFTAAHLDEFRELTALSAGFIRRALLLEQMEFERELLTQEAQLLAALASSDGDGELDQALVDGLRRALRADQVIVLARHFASETLTPLTSPPNALSAEQVAALKAAAAQPGNETLLGPAPESCYINADLAESAPSPAEAWLRDAGGWRSLAVASGDVAEGRKFAIAAMRRDPGAWEGSTLAFLARIARVVELNIARHRTRTIAAHQAERLDAQARLLTALDPTRPLTEIAKTFAEEIEARFSLECLAILRWSQPHDDDPVLYRSSRLPNLMTSQRIPTPSGYAVITSGKAEYLDLEAERRSPVEELLYRSGLRRLGRVPIGPEGSVSGFVSVTWEDDGDPAERLRALEDAVRPLALVIERAGLLANIERQQRALQATADILSTLGTTREMDEACAMIAERLRSFFRADHVALGTINIQAGRRSVLGFSSSVVDRADLPNELLPGDRAAYNASLRGEPDIFEDLQGMDLNGGTAIAQRAGLRALVRARFELSDGETGLITVASCKPGQYAEQDAAELLELSRTISIAIDRMRLIAHMAETTALLGAQTRILAALAPGATIESAGEVFVKEARQLFGASHALVARVLPRLSIAALSSDHMSAAELAFNEPSDPTRSARYAGLMHGEGQLVDDLALHQRAEIEDLALRKGLRTLMRAPLISSTGEPAGLITLGSPKPNAWNEADLSVLTELASALALVAERAALFDSAEERSATVGALTRLLGTFNVDAPPREVAQLFAGEVRRFLRADGVLVVAFDAESGTKSVVALDTELPGELFNGNVSDLNESATYAWMLEHTTANYDARQPELAPQWLIDSSRAVGLGSVVAVRLDVEGTPVGMIAVGSVAPGRMREHELQILAEVAAPLAMLLERARVVTSLQQQTLRTRAVLDVLAALGPKDTLEEVGQPVAEALRAMFGADHVTINAVENEEVLLVGVDSSIARWPVGHRSEPSQAFRELIDMGYQVLTDTRVQPGTVTRIASFLHERGVRSSVRVLIGTREAPLGFATLASRAPHKFSDADARELAQIVQPLGVAISFFRGRREAEQRTLRLEYTNRILTRLSAGGTAEHLAAGFLAECRVLFQCPHAMAFSFEQAKQTARLLGVDSDIAPADLVAGSPVSDVKAKRIFAQGGPELIRDARTESEGTGFHEQLIDAGLYSVIRAPLIVRDTVHGAVSLWARGTNAFGSEDADLLGTLTRPFAVALEKAAALQSLGESELKYRSLVAQAEEMIFQFDSETRAILDANQYTSRALGYSPQELLTMRLDDIIDAQDGTVAENIAQTLETGELHLVDRHYRRKDGLLLDVDMVASLVSYGGRQAVLVLARDVSERKAFQRQLMQGQKMESLGTMAGHVAHDFNNLLTTILGFAGLLKRSTNMDTEERENLALIEDAARRAGDLTGHLLSFARGGLVRVGPVDLRTVVADTMRLAEPSLHSALRATTTLPSTAVMVEGDSGQLQHAIFNIVSNARDAMPEGGKIDIKLETDGVTATLVIADNGPGMDDETRTRIFEPFYTTKPLGTGTGLGMSITFGIIQGHHGDIAVQTRKGKGTTFTITLPLLPAESHAGSIDIFNAGDGNLVLVVDDDEMVRRTTSATLAALGYNVVEAPGGATAVEIVRARPERFSVVLLDLVMPGMTGSETFRALTAIRPDLPVVVCTGYAADAHIDTDVKRRIAGLVQKPFTGERLARALVAAGAMPTRG
jgi:PAS domain S-box-containing protein